MTTVGGVGSAVRGLATKLARRETRAVVALLGLPSDPPPHHHPGPSSSQLRRSARTNLNARRDQPVLTSTRTDINLYHLWHIA